MKVLTHFPWIRHLARGVGARLFRWAENNGDCDLTKNGEAWFVDALVSHWARTAHSAGQRRVVVDAGANRGDFTAAVVAASVRTGVAVEVHAIDPAASCAEALRRRFAGNPAVRLLQAAVGEQAGTLRLNFAAAGSTHASLLPRKEAEGGTGEDVAVVRLDEYLDRCGVERVAFLKLDVEGFELAALRGLGERLHPDRIEVVQFEYGGTTLDAGGSLRAFFVLFEARGYAVAKLLPRALEIRRYAPWMDSFAYANYVAVPPSWRGVAERGSR